MILLYLYLFALHFIADFILQPREMGRRKSECSLKGLKYLLAHIFIVFSVFFVGLIIFAGWQFALIFAVFNAVLHFIIDAIIWKGYMYSVWKRRHKLLGYDKGESPPRSDKEIKKTLKVHFKYWEDSWFYATIGLDQLLHFSTIVFFIELIRMAIDVHI